MSAALYRLSGSWIKASAKNTDLLYVSSYDNGQNKFEDVFVFTFPGARLVGRLTGLTSPSGMCTNGAGDVFVTEYFGAAIVEYRHGNAVPIRTLEDANTYPVSCSVDPTTGNLVVVNNYGAYGNSSLSLYTKARGSRKLFYEYIVLASYCAFDSRGNLYVDGINGSGEPGLAELAKGANEFTSVSLPGRVGDGGLEWDGKYLAVGSPGNYVYRLRVSRSRATIKGQTYLNGASGLSQFSIAYVHSRSGMDKGILAGPDYTGVNVKLWTYPEGGDAKTTISPIDQPFGTAISLAKR